VSQSKKSVSKVRSAAALAVLLLLSSSPSYAAYLPSGGTASVQRFTEIWNEEEEELAVTPKAEHPKLFYSPVVLDLARIIGRFRGAPGYATEQDPLEEERSIISKKSGSLRLPPVLNQEPNLTPETPEPKNPLSLDLPSIDEAPPSPLGTPHQELPPIVASALTARVRPDISAPNIQTSVDNSFLLWTLQSTTTGGDNGWTHDSSEPYKATFIECTPGTRIRSMVADRVSFESGRALISNRGGSLKVLTPMGEFTLPADSAVILDCSKDNVRVIALDSGSTGISILKGGRFLTQIGHGQEAVIDVNGNASKTKISVSQYLSSDPLLRGENKLEPVQKSALAELKSRLIDERQVSK
jgi:hypothetical protein